MAYRELPPGRPLAGVVECGWTSTTTAGAATPVVLPDGCMDLLWDGATLLVAGPDTAPHPARQDPGAVAAGLRFAPGALPGLLGVPASALRDRRVPLAELHPRLGRGTTARLADRAAPPLALLTGLALALPGRGTGPGLVALAARIDAGAGVAATADHLGWTTRTLHRRCLESFGYGPAMLRRVLRFRRAMALLHTGSAPADVAVAVGYADQPHLSREVRALGGTSPGRIAAQTGPT